MTYFCTFLIRNMTSEFGLDFSWTRLFLNKESHYGFISYFVFPLKQNNKNKWQLKKTIFKKNGFFCKEIKLKSESHHRMGMYVKNAGPHIHINT